MSKFKWKICNLSYRDGLGGPCRQDTSTLQVSAQKTAKKVWASLHHLRASTKVEASNSTLHQKDANAFPQLCAVTHELSSSAAAGPVCFIGGFTGQELGKPGDVDGARGSDSLSYGCEALLDLALHGL